MTPTPFVDLSETDASGLFLQLLVAGNAASVAIGSQMISSSHSLSLLYASAVDRQHLNGVMAAAGTAKAISQIFDGDDRLYALINQIVANTQNG